MSRQTAAAKAAALKGGVGGKPWLGHPLHPIPITKEVPKDVRESTYVEPEFSEFLGEYALRGGMSRSHALRRLAILGAISEGYEFVGDPGEYVHAAWIDE